MIWKTQPRSEGAGALHYFELGAGPVVVAIHGVGLRAEAWSALAPLLEQNYRIICVDMPGHGGSPLGDVSDLWTYVARFEIFLEAIGEPVFLLGHSMGALIATELAARCRGMVFGIAGLNTVYRRDIEARRAVCARALALAENSPPDPEPTLRRWFGDTPSGTDKEASDTCRGWLLSGSANGYKSAYQVFARTDGPTEQALSKITCPTLFLTGVEDRNSTPAMSRALAKATSGLAGDIAHAAHMVPMTHADNVAGHLRRLFSSPHVIPNHS